MLKEKTIGLMLVLPRENHWPDVDQLYLVKVE
jgi:hypothetical protein